MKIPYAALRFPKKSFSILCWNIFYTFQYTDLTVHYL
jgi:hypothetical protein